MQGIGPGFVPAVLNREVIDEVLACPDEAAIALPSGGREGGRPGGRLLRRRPVGAREIAERPE
jgi:hypothetical protein